MVRAGMGEAQASGGAVLGKPRKLWGSEASDSSGGAGGSRGEDGV